MDASDRLPHWTLRREVLDMLAAHYEAAEEGTFPPISPAGLLADLNAVGPTLGNDCLPMIEAVLDDLYHQGRVARIPAPSPRHTPLYMSRESAEAALKWNAPVILLPLTEKSRWPPTHLDGRRGQPHQ